MQHRSRLMPLILVLLVTLAIVQLSIAFSNSTPSYEWFDPLIDIRGALVERHLVKPDENAMQKAAINAMIEALDDPHAVYVPDELEKTFIKDLEGDYAGIGAEVRLIDGNLVIITPMDGSPALAAGIRAGDIIVQIDSEPATNETIQALIERLTGPVGTEVVVHVLHTDETKEVITIKRGHIQSPSVAGLVRRQQHWSWYLDKDHGIAYIRIRQFNDTTPQELITAIQDATKSGQIHGVVLDLRDNPGGALSAAITISNMFLDHGTIVTVTGRVDPIRSWEAQPDHLLPDVPLLVLVNSNSASASEIVAGSLQANDRAAILGTRTYGKGSVQEVIELASGGMLKFTTGRYDLANGRIIDKRLSTDSGIWGVDPNEGLVIRETLDQSIERYKNREPYIVITSDEPEDYTCGSVSWIDDILGDHQLAQALLAVRHKQETGQWPTLSEEDPIVSGIQIEVGTLAKQRLNILKALVDVDRRLTGLQTELDEQHESLIPPETDLTNALMTISDKDGNIIGTWRVANGNLEAALDSLQLEPELNNIEQ